jgi:putative flavoprotein involved in K+ transport
MPLHQRGVTTEAGLYFLGLPWLHKWKSAFLFGADEDAAYLAGHIVSGTGLDRTAG